MDQMQFIQVQEFYEQENVTVKFVSNNQEVLKKVEYKSNQNNSEQYSQQLYEHLHNYIPQEGCFIYFIEPLECIEQSRWNFTSQLCADIILKLLNIKYIPIIRTNYTKYNFEAIKSECKSIIDKMNYNLQTICQNKSNINKEFITSLKEFKQYYGIELLRTSTKKPLQKEHYSELDVIYVPTEELIFRKTNKQYSFSSAFQQLEQINKSNQLI